MNIKRFILAIIAVFVTNQATDFVVHGPILGKFYMATETLWRPNMGSLMWIMSIGSLIFSVLFVYIFIRGYENKGILEGLRFGIIIGLLMSLVGSLAQYVVYPVPFYLASLWAVCGMVQYMLYGIITALIYKPKQ